MKNLRIALIGLAVFAAATIGCFKSKGRVFVDANGCQLRLQRIYRQLTIYQRTNPHFPLDDTGQPDFAIIFPEGTDANDYSCPTSQTGVRYLFKRGLKPGDLNSELHNVVIGLDASENHSLGGGKEVVALLFADGIAITRTVESETAKAWEQVLEDGGILTDD